MTTHSFDAEGISGLIAVTTWYPRVADVVALAIRNCALEGCAMNDDQATQLYRAALEAGDGVMQEMTHEIDTYLARRLISTVQDDQDWDGGAV